MASILDQLAFRKQEDELTALHDEWMHSSTNTSSAEQGTFDFAPGNPSPDISLPPSMNTLGFSPSDVSAFMRKLYPGNDNEIEPQASIGANPTSGVEGTYTINPHKHKHKADHKKHKQKGGGGGGGGAAGANLGPMPKLGNVPYTTTPAGGSGTSPIFLVLMLGGGVLVVYFIWHKLRKSKAEDKEMDKKGE